MAEAVNCTNLLQSTAKANSVTIEEQRMQNKKHVLGWGKGAKCKTS